MESPKGVGGDSAGQLRRGAKARIVTGESILFVKERHGDGTQFWILPGGGIHTQKSPEAGLRWKMQEELNCRVHIRDRVGKVVYAHHSSEAVTEYTVLDC